MTQKEGKMKEFIVMLSKKYGIPAEKMQNLVLEVIERVEQDLPVTLKEKIETDLGGTIKNKLLKESGLYPIP
jgi:hypothetical protein